MSFETIEGSITDFGTPRAHDMVGFGKRLNAIDGTTSDLVQRVDLLIGLVSKNAIYTGPPRYISIDPQNVELCDLADDETGVDKQIALESPDDLLSTGTPNVVVDNDGGERFYGGSSTFSLFTGARRTVRDILTSCSVSATASEIDFPISRPVLIEIQQQYDTYQFPPPYQEKDLGAISQRLELPPRSLLDASLDIYFDTVSLETPIFQRRSFSALIDNQYSASASELDGACISCFNSVILQSVGFHSVGWKSSYLQPKCSFADSVKDDLLGSLLDNSKRALQNTDQFFKPRIINIQAMLSLVSPTHCS